MEVDGETPVVASQPGTSYKIATANPRDIRIWEFHFEPEKKDGQEPTTALRGKEGYVIHTVSYFSLAPFQSTSSQTFTTTSRLH